MRDLCGEGPPRADRGRGHDRRPGRPRLQATDDTAVRSVRPLSPAAAAFGRRRPAQAVRPRRPRPPRPPGPTAGAAPPGSCPAQLKPRPRQVAGLGGEFTLRGLARQPQVRGCRGDLMTMSQ
ncbi:hypothetical protein ACQ4WX_47265 [Streptomyces lasalocidi]